MGGKRSVAELSRFGFSPTGGGVHSARTMMFGELGLLLSVVPDVTALPATYVQAVVQDNCLAKRSIANRRRTAQHLLTLYSLDPSLALFRALRTFWRRDPIGRPLLALCCACSRDMLLRQTVPFVVDRSEGSVVTRTELEGYLEAEHPGRFSGATLKSVAQNINATLTDSGHLAGKAVKTRSHATATAGAVAYALLLGYLEGARGMGLLSTDYAMLMDCSKERIVELASDASARGWIVFKHISDVYDVSFPSLLTSEEMEWVHEQS